MTVNFEKMRTIVVSRTALLAIVHFIVKLKNFPNYFIIKISFAVTLTDGKTILMDIELRPKLNHKGIVCVNKEGTWSIDCVRRGNLAKNTELAGLICFKLGFSGYNFFNVSSVDANGEILSRDLPEQKRNAFYQDYLPNTRQAGSFGRPMYKRSVDTIDLHHQIRSHEIIIGAPQKHCNALYLECVPHSHIPTDDNGTPSPSEHITTTPESIAPIPDDAVHHTTVPSTNSHPSIHPENEHTTNLPAEFGNTTEPRIIEDNFSAPWIASVYIDGDLKCIGVLLDRNWVLVDSSCVELAEYV